MKKKKVTKNNIFSNKNVRINSEKVNRFKCSNVSFYEQIYLLIFHFCDVNKRFYQKKYSFSWNNIIVKYLKIEYNI